MSNARVIANSIRNLRKKFGLWQSPTDVTISTNNNDHNNNATTTSNSEIPRRKSSSKSRNNSQSSQSKSNSQNRTKEQPTDELLSTPDSEDQDSKLGKQEL